MARGWTCTLLATSVPTSTEKLQLKIEGGGGLRADFQITKNCKFTGTFDVIPKMIFTEQKGVLCQPWALNDRILILTANRWFLCMVHQIHCSQSIAFLRCIMEPTASITLKGRQCQRGLCVHQYTKKGQKYNWT